MPVRETGLYYLQSRYYNPTWGRFLNADVFVATGQGLLGNNMFAYCLNNPVNAVDPTGHAGFMRISIFDDPTKEMFFGFGGGGGGGGGCSGTIIGLCTVAKDGLPEHTTSLGVSAGTSMYGHTNGVSGNVVGDTSGDAALQYTTTVGESTCVAPGASVGICKTYSTADDVQLMAGNSSSVGFTFCPGIGISIDFSWFDTPQGSTEYAITIGVVWGAEFEIHGSASQTSSTASWDVFH